MVKPVGVMIAILVLSMLFPACSPVEKQITKKDIKTDADKISYTLGMEFGPSLKPFENEIDMALFAKGLEDSHKNNEALLSPEEIEETRKRISKKVQAYRQREKNRLAEKNLKEGQAFLAENKKKQGVVTTESGLQYIVVNEGSGPKPKKTDRVKVHYRGMLIDGTEFDSSYKRGKSVVFSLQGIIPGWIEALQLMTAGSKYTLFIPPDLGYGNIGAGRLIGPNAVLIFEVELLGIEKPKK
ncbi:MAG: FKBP-type peptidyl-prolyl cis-trans isomerase [Thermodesulfobacteriota bacterium]|nr:FKBP-type peptidyl-prolyl cis-trans isomerase [Thermodesulfobacteriota bacterium]